MSNSHPAASGNLPWRLAMRRAGFKKGWVNRIRCRAIMRNGQPCGRLAMVSAGVFVCGCHGGYAAAVRKGLRNPTRKYLMYRPLRKTSKSPI
jgi:hypothetical protein